jgi:hypothetical protein
MAHMKENFDEWRKQYEAADKQTKALMRLQREEHRANQEKEKRKELKRAIDRLVHIRLEESLQEDDSMDIAADIHTVISAARDHLRSEQAHKWQTQLLKSEWKLLHQFVVEQVQRIAKVKAIGELDDATIRLQCYAACYTEGLLNPVPPSFDYLEMLARESRDDIKKDLRARLAKEHIYIQESGEMIIDEEARARRQEWGTDQSE